MIGGMTHVALVLWLFTTSIVILGVSGPAVAQPERPHQLELAPAPDQQKRHHPSERDQAQLDEGRVATTALLALVTEATTLNGSRADIQPLQALIDARVVQPERALLTAGLGILFGDVLASELGLSWVVVDDHRGRDLALSLHGTEVLVFPIQMIQRRLIAANDSGTPFDLSALFAQVSATIFLYL